MHWLAQLYLALLNMEKELEGKTNPLQSSSQLIRILVGEPILSLPLPV